MQYDVLSKRIVLVCIAIEMVVSPGLLDFKKQWVYL